MATCCEVSKCACAAPAQTTFTRVSASNTLAFNAALCINCGMCSAVCPHGVFVGGKKVVQIARPGACMECGACALNCPMGALQVDSGVGCAAAMIYAALTGKAEATSGGPEPGCC